MKNRRQSIQQAKQYFSNSEYREQWHADYAAQVEESNERKRITRKFILYPGLVLLFGLWVYVTFFATSA
jgi:hypothetical protein